MRYAITPETMKAREQAAMERGVPALLLMENAAAALENALGDARDVLCVCGAGNNGGDGLAVARRLLLRGACVRVYLADGARTPEAETQLKYLLALGAEPKPLSAFIHGAPRANACVDALFGTGLSRALEGEALDAVRAINALDTRVVSVDIPSGMSGLTGLPMPECVHADTTVTFHMEKLGLLLSPERGAAGRVIVAPIGLPDSADTPYAVLEPGHDLLGALARDAHKGARGRALIIAGSRNMPGAAALCANAAMRSGAGLCRIACDGDAAHAILALAPCATRVRRAVVESIEADAIAIGPGMGQDENAVAALAGVRRRTVPAVYDADALSLLAHRPRALSEHSVITPHPGEAARLLDCNVSDITGDRLKAARALREQYQCTVLLKGAVPLMISADGSKTALCAFGTPGLAKGGSGDVLTGILTGLLPAYNGDVWRATLAACARHAEAACRAVNKYGEHEMLATDLIQEICVSRVRRQSPPDDSD